MTASARLITPQQFLSHIPKPPVFSNDKDPKSTFSLQRFRIRSCEIDVPPTRDHVISMHLAGATSLEVMMDGSRLRRWAEMGHVSITPAGEPTRWLVKGNPDVAVVHIPTYLVDEVAMETFERRVVLSPIVATRSERVARLMWILLDETATSQVDGFEGGRLLQDLLLRALVINLLRSSCSNAQPSLVRAGAMTPMRLNRVVDYIRSNLSTDLSLVDLANVYGCSQTHFARIFRESMGEPPYRYVVRLRVEVAKTLLQQTTLDIAEIALRCGFSQPHYFSSSFGKLTGMSPRAYRNAAAE